MIGFHTHAGLWDIGLACPLCPCSRSVLRKSHNVSSGTTSNRAIFGSNALKAIVIPLYLLLGPKATFRRSSRRSAKGTIRFAVHAAATTV
ncbi:hypothetical protein DEV91_14710 [Phyllobacterium brassicacearum]|nr:hypothetical protein DEV91_14710 [Phyllobacterium brassicacearum]